jgi:hypothetical protein
MTSREKPTCPKHPDYGDPSCQDCWKALFKVLNKHNIYAAMDESTKDMIDSARKK